MLQNELKKLIWAFIVPTMIVWGILNIYPMVSSFYWAMTDYDGITKASEAFTGLQNYQRMLNDVRWWESMRNTFIIAIGMILTILPISLLFAVLITNTKRGQGFLKTFVYLPSVLPTVIVALLWVFILDPQVGLFGFALDGLNIRSAFAELFHLRSLNLMANPATARYMVILITLWASVGSYTLYFLAGLSRIPQDYYDAAKIDGANGWCLFWNITFPLLYPTIQTITLLLIIGSLQNFGFIYVVSAGSPGPTIQVMATYIYRTAFSDNRFGYATALGTIMMVVVFTFTLISRRLTKRETFQY